MIIIKTLTLTILIWESVFWRKGAAYIASLGSSGNIAFEGYVATSPDFYADNICFFVNNAFCSQKYDNMQILSDRKDREIERKNLNIKLY